MHIVNAAQMREIDNTAIKEYGIPGVVLMENAGRLVYEEILNSLKDKKYCKVAIISGHGNNGGDGYVAARHLFQKGIAVELFVVGSTERPKGDAGVNYDIFKKLGIKHRYLLEEGDLKGFEYDLKDCDLIVDAILGTGLARELDVFLKKIIQIINYAQKEVISIDIPSGVGADDGNIYGAAIKASKTVTFQLPKLGNIQYPGADYTGKLIIKDIGIPKEIIDNMNIKTKIITKEMVQEILPPRKNDTHKGVYGKVCIIAGSVGMGGAAVLASKSVLRSGAGLLRVVVPNDINDILQIGIPEAITVPLKGSKDMGLGPEDREKLIEIVGVSDAIAIGPGCGQGGQFRDILATIIENIQNAIVLDADALNILAQKAEILNTFNGHIIMSPHIAEMSRLTKLDMEYIERNRVDVASEFAKRWNATILLKGARTVVADPQGKIFINTIGNPGMATAGSGDVLTGIITGLIGQGIEPTDAVAAAAYIHGYAGELAAESLGEYGLLAGDIVAKIPLAIQRLLKE